MSSHSQISSARAVVGAEVLVIDKDENVRAGVTELCTQAKMIPTCVADPADAWEILRSRTISACVVDLDTPSPGAGVETVASIQLVSKTTKVLVLTPRQSYQDGIEAIRAGAIDVIYKSPESVSYLNSQIIAAAAASQKLIEERSVLKKVASTHEKFLQLLMAAEREVVDLRDRVLERTPTQLGAELQVLVVDPSDAMVSELAKLAPEGFSVAHATSGGAALDKAGSGACHIAIVSDQLVDLPQSMVIRSLKAQNEELVTLSFRGPGPAGKVEIVGAQESTAIVSDFQKVEQLVERLPQLAEAFRAKEEQRRYTSAFREKHYDFVRRWVRLKEQIDSFGEVG